MNKALKVAGLSFALMAAGMGSAFAETKIAVVDMGEVFQKLPQREAVTAKLKGEFEPRMRELQKLEQEGQKLVEKFRKDEAFMSAEQKKQNQEKLAKLQMEFIVVAKTSARYVPFLSTWQVYSIHSFLLNQPTL